VIKLLFEAINNYPKTMSQNEILNDVSRKPDGVSLTLWMKRKDYGIKSNIINLI